jgi:carbamoyl-phosphate synthase large subunit
VQDSGPTQTKVLITGIGGLTCRGVAASLKQFAARGAYHVVGTDCNAWALGLYEEDLVDEGLLLPACNDARYWDRVEEIVRSRGIEVAVVQTESEIEAWAERARTSGLPCPAFLPPVSLIRACRDKAACAELLADTGLVPPTVCFERSAVQDLLRAAGLGFPFWIRAARGTSGLAAYKVCDGMALRAWVQLNPNIEYFTASPYLPGQNLACKVLYYRGRLLRTACAKRGDYALANAAPSGVTGVNAFGWFVNRPDLVDLSTTAIELLSERLGVTAHGMFSVDFKEDENAVPKITEINVRCIALVGALAARGANFPEDLILLALGRDDYINDCVHHQFEESIVFLRDFVAVPKTVPQRELRAVPPAKTSLAGSVEGD